MGAQGSTRKLVGAKSLPKHGGERTWAAAQARSASLSADEGLCFTSCVRGTGGMEEQDGQGEVPVMKGLFLILCFIRGFLQHNFF